MNGSFWDNINIFKLFDNFLIYNNDWIQEHKFFTLLISLVAYCFFMVVPLIIGGLIEDKLNFLFKKYK